MRDQVNVLFKLTYGSKLYGTDTPTSDTDVKAIYLPELDSILLGRQAKTSKLKYDADGERVPDDVPMPANGIETEYIPFQTFVRDFVAGQTYAVEVAFALAAQEPEADSLAMIEIVDELIGKFTNAEVYSMVGFAKKQTFDYVRRGERLTEARKVRAALNRVLSGAFQRDMIRLDTRWDDTKTVLDVVAFETGLPIGESINNNRPQRTLIMNGRNYLETSNLEHLVKAVQKLIDGYGERTNDAAEAEVDYKSLSHAVRVYEQAIELLDTGRITFPRSNAVELLSIKSGLADLEVVKAKLQTLDDMVLEKMATTTVQARTPELVERSEAWLLKRLREFYRL